MSKRTSNSSDATTQIKIGMSQTFDSIMLPLSWVSQCKDMMTTYRETGASIKSEPANTRKVINGLLDGTYHLAVICTSLQDEVYSNKDIRDKLILEFHEEVIALDGFSLITAMPKDDSLIATITEGIGPVCGDWATTKPKLLRALRGDSARGCEFMVREEGSGTRTYIERHILTGIVDREMDGQCFYGKAKTLGGSDKNLDMIFKFAGNDTSHGRVATIVADSILDGPAVSWADGFSRIRILGVERPFCLVRKKTSKSKAVLECCDYIREASALFRARSGGRVFIGHGGSDIWKKLKDYLESLGLECTEFNFTPQAGLPTGARIKQMLDKSCFAFLVMTGEDKQADGTLHARANVIHELGLFQARLGTKKAIILLEEGCTEFTNIGGLGQIRFAREKISEKFTEINRVLRREKLAFS